MTATALSPALASSGRSLFGSKDGALFFANANHPPHDAPAVQLLASSAARRGQLTRAGRLLWDLVAANPQDREMRLALVMVMMQRDQPVEALKLLEEVLAQQPDDARVAERKGFILANLGRLDEAAAIYDRTVSAHPEIPPLRVARGNILLSLGRQQAAVDDYRQAIALDPTYGEAWWALANIKTVALTRADINTMLAVLSWQELPPVSRVNIHFALGKAFEDSKLPDRSFGHYQRANELQALGAVDPRAAIDQFVDRQTESIGPDYFSHREDDPSPGPIFIVGMPRSGTTLVEQILASHPDVEGTSELPTISAIARSIGEGLGRSEFDYWDLLEAYSDSALAALGQLYLRQSAAYRHSDRPFFIDKMPSNWMHAALIRLILPNARILDVRRDPLDCCFSNFAQNYPRGHEFAHSLEGLGHHYRTYERLMAHFDAVAPGMITRLDYQQLVDRQEATIRSLLDSLSLPFAESCLRFFENDRPVRTPSVQQVRQPINRRGTGRAEQYMPWLGPLLDALGSSVRPA